MVCTVLRKYHLCGHIPFQLMGKTWCKRTQNLLFQNNIAIYCIIASYKTLLNYNNTRKKNQYILGSIITTLLTKPKKCLT